MDTSKIPDPILEVFRGVGQVFFEENALTGALMSAGLAFNSPLMATGAVVGSAIGTATARAMKFDEGEIKAGIYGFNSTLIGIATFFHFQPSVMSVILLIAGCVAGAFVTRLMRGHVPFPTYTAPFIVTTWAVYFLGLALHVAQVPPSDEPADTYLAGSIPGIASAEGEATAEGKPAPSESRGNIAIDIVEAATRAIGEVKFQGSIWTGILFLVGIGLNNKVHAAWVFVASLIATFVAVYHHDPSHDVALGLSQYSAPLTAVALYLWRKSLVAPLLGIMLSVPLTEVFPLTGLPTYTAPFVLAAWIVIFLEHYEDKLFGKPKIAV
ncbi:MAG: urea transporter [Paludisphaera borealis]|uniref:urea transporter n=1 Tax=Paludisphaera borealis TaxID=1387353 RepID=UPI002843078E|nr:urea transporter [Paludisphaera borealis]MDR3619116.1 urea transporter [Paludisphaera borealis]